MYSAPPVPHSAPITRFIWEWGQVFRGLCGQPLDDVVRIITEIAFGHVVKRARASGRKDADIPFREAALAAFHKRRAKLISEVEKIDATLASMQCN